MPRRREGRAKSLVGALLFQLLVALVPVGEAAAQSLELELTPTSLAGTPGSTLVFTGRITNTTGRSLHAMDLFLNFIAYDPTVFADITQLVWDSDFVLDNNRFISDVPLFSVFLASSALSGLHTLEVTLQDIYESSSSIVTASVDVESPPTVAPEPASLLLLSMGVAGLALRRRRGRR